MRRVRIAALARTVEGIRARLSRHAKLAFGLRIPGLEIVVRERPVRQAGAGHRSLAGEHLEIVGTKAPRPTRPAQHHAADHVSGRVVAPRLGLLALVVAIGLEMVLCKRVLAQDHAELVVAELPGRELRAALEGHNVESCAGELLAHDAAARAGTDHADVELTPFGHSIPRRKAPLISRHSHGSRTHASGPRSASTRMGPRVTLRSHSETP